MGKVKKKKVGGCGSGSVDQRGTRARKIKMKGVHEKSQKQNRPHMILGEKEKGQVSSQHKKQGGWVVKSQPPHCEDCGGGNHRAKDRSEGEKRRTGKGRVGPFSL